MAAITILGFHALMLLLGVGIACRWVPEQPVRSLLGYLHKTIGITTPSPQQERMIAIIWLASVVVIADGCLFLLVSITKLSSAG
jgi:hypothetical protein